ncbi:glycoside hydrolase family 32 protein [Jeotgalibacillus aurantiacus]|uniref:glycoside hydrolase family 32 protein n=1 Tax=Jeotgalibacillus aurantiacus TaxID=2763266 RepID=UPI001D0AF22D|nr:sucrose-6-phosphate hydrolase [Jeotgalibacillus aurantiacus]
MREQIEKAEQSVREKQAEEQRHHWYPRFHVAPRAYWMNDPNGFSFFKGEYHLFYQHHPFSPEWGPMYWGHVKSRDLVRWEHLPIALAPSEDFDKDGCFSGSAIEKDGKLLAIYTGNVWTGPDHDTDLKQVQAVAESEDGIYFTKWEEPVISEAPDGDVHPFHFRDPKVWQHEDQYYCVLGSRTKDHVGQVLLYRSANLKEWEFVAVSANKKENGGYMWECPDFFHLGEHDVLVMSPQGVKPEGDRFHNLHQAVYVLGKLNYETGAFDHGDFEMLDAGFDFYAPQTLEDPEGRRILIGWMDMWESEMPTQKIGFSGAMTIPRLLVPNGNRLLVQPLPELAELRKEAVLVEQTTFTGKQTFDYVSGTCLEMKVEADVASTDALHINMRCGEREKTVLSWTRSDSKLTLDRSESGEGVIGVRTTAIETVNNRLKLHIFLDQSSVEVFANDGERVMTARIYPKEDSDGIEFVAEGKVTLRIEKWDLSPAFTF